ncbi:ketopantoate reductase family protein [Thioalkalivibrio sp. HK1]|uniref:ketopantoate reductase family protein n=1 Tax=Thioalkalivibrio sp. HK1 TaxID=1469245 RepID=UPI000472A24F|nr:2-dehydropantoate 2-reductase [Thioalkalivibrio sp. HK1]
MKIAVVGTGAMGSVYAALLADAGNDVWAIDTWAEHIDVIRREGLRVEGASGDRTVSLSATDDPEEVGSCDLVIIATKASGVEAAAASLPPLLGDDTVVLTIQNGLGAAERICRHIEADRVLLGVAGGFGAAMRAPGHAWHNGMEMIRLGELEGEISERLEGVARVWRDAGFNVRCFDDIEQLVWEKFVCNVAFSGPCTVFHSTVGELLDNPHIWQVSRSCAEEAFLAGVALGVNFSFDDPVDYVRDFGGRIRQSRPSMLQDHLARRRSEIDAINGMVPVVAEKAGTLAPHNETISAIVRYQEERFDREG